MEQKRFIDIERIKSNYADGFCVGDHIIIQEKIDGANFSIRYDNENDSIAAFSRKKPLDEVNNLRGAYQWSLKQDKELIKKVLGDNLILFGEWLCPHTIVYPKERYHKPYFFDVYDVSSERYLVQEEVRRIIRELGLTYVPVFYDGNFVSWDSIYEFVGRTELGGETGEGIVIKNMTRLNDPNTRLPFYVKIVCEKFSETKGVKKPIDPDKLKRTEELQLLVDSIVTENRITKILHKMIDDNVIPEDWNEHSMQVIAKNIGKLIYEDCVKEEPETVEAVGYTFGKLAHRKAMNTVRTMLNNQ